MHPKVSVVMCSYNGLLFMKEAIQSVVNQTYTNWELIISDDCSTHETREWLQTNYGDHPQVRIFFQDSNLGYLANKNFAHQQASGDYLTQLDNDDLMDPEKLERQVNAAIKGYKLVSCGFNRIDIKGNVCEITGQKEEDIFRRPTIEGYPFWFPSLLVHKEVFQQIGYFNEYFSRALGDDVYWTMKANQYYTIHHIGAVLYSYRSNPGSITNNYKNVRKLLMPVIIDTLSAQRQKTGTDWLEQEAYDKLAEMEYDLMKNNSFMAGKYRTCAAIAAETGQRKTAVGLLWKAFKRTPFSPAVYKTAIYILCK